MNSGPVVSSSAHGTVSLKPDTARHLRELSSQMGVSVDDIVSEALDDWIDCVAPARLEAMLDSQNEKFRLDRRAEIQPSPSSSERLAIPLVVPAKNLRAP
jgi:hypothetical protein